MFFEIQAKHTKDLYNLDLVFNGLNQASKIFQNNWEVIPQKFKNYRQKKRKEKRVIIVGNIPETTELLSGVFTRWK